MSFSLISIGNTNSSVTTPLGDRLLSETGGWLYLLVARVPSLLYVNSIGSPPVPLQHAMGCTMSMAPAARPRHVIQLRAGMPRLVQISLSTDNVSTGRRPLLPMHDDVYYEWEVPPGLPGGTTTHPVSLSRSMPSAVRDRAIRVPNGDSD